jgi:Transposase DDE domain
MSCRNRLSQWEHEVSTAFAHLSKPQIWGLVLWSAGIALSGSAGITQISALLALVLCQGEQSVFQRLREWYLDADQKSGSKRRDLDVTTCFAPLLRWVLRLWQSETKQLALVLDATTLGNRWTILVISVVVRGCAIPVAWKVLPAEQEGSWRPYWEGLLTSLEEGVPAGWEVIVLADRGLYARWLWDAIRACGWHPFLRLNTGIKARALRESSFEWISRWIPAPGASWKGEVECFAGKKSRVNGTLLMHWEAGYESAWVILTDLSPEQALVSWYGVRTWIEGGFKDFKRGLWGWHHSKMQRASSVERLWLALALAQLWCVSLGCQAEVGLEEQVQHHEPGASLPANHLARRRRKRPLGQLPPRRLSCVVRGRLELLAMLFQAEAFSVGILQAEVWPQTMTPPQKHHPAGRSKKKTRKEKERRKRQKRRARARAHTQD